MPLKIIILVEIHLRVHVGTWLFSSWSVSQCFIHYYLPTIHFCGGSLITSNLNFLIQTYSAALCQVSLPVYTSWRLCKRLPEEALPALACPALCCSSQVSWLLALPPSPACAALPFSTLLGQHCQLHTAVRTLQTLLLWHASFAQGSDQTACVLRREEDSRKEWLFRKAVEMQ